MKNLPRVGSPEWHAWRKSGMPIERWLDERPVNAVHEFHEATTATPPAAQPTIEAQKASGDGQKPSVDPGASQEGRVTQAPDPWEGFDPTREP